MLRRHEQFYHQLLQIVDAFVLAGALWLAHFLRIHLSVFPVFDAIEVGPISNYLWLLVIIFPAGPLLLEFQGFYRLNYPQNGWTTVGRVIRAIFYLWLVLMAVIVFLRIPSESLSRGVFVLFLPLGILAIVARDFFFRWWYQSHGLSQTHRRSVLLCATPEQCRRWREQFQALPDRQLIIRGEFHLSSSMAEGIDRFVGKLHAENIEIVLFELDHSRLAEINQAIKACEAEGIEAWVTTDFITTTLARPQFDELLGRPLLVFRSTPDAAWQLLMKSCIDRTGALCVLLLISPLLLAIALAVFFTSGRPILFSQARSGRHGTPFRMYKFRTMITQAEQSQAELRAFNQMSGPVFKMTNDPRVTPLGHWLRKFSLDELPQLWNVLRGDMSLVGPRPLPVAETERFTDYAHRRRLSVKPGLTCLWQVAGRSNITDFSDWVRLDLEYIDHWSLWGDIRILFRTIPVVLFGKGAK